MINPVESYDYSQAGACFVTIYTKDRECIFGKIVDKEMRINDKGAIVHTEWLRTTEIRINVITRRIHNYEENPQMLRTVQ